MFPACTQRYPSGVKAAGAGRVRRPIDVRPALLRKHPVVTLCQRHGDPRHFLRRRQASQYLHPVVGTYRRPPLLDRLRAKATTDSKGCLVWQTGKSYNTGPYREVYEYFVGPIPPGYVIDHLCCNRKCVYFRHLEAVTPGENRKRDHARRKLGQTPWLRPG